MHRGQQDQRNGIDQLALGLGWFSIALGVAELAAPINVARLIGVPEDDESLNTLRACGAREIGAGVAILAQPERAAWMWSRVGGDALDLSLLGAAAQRDGADRGRLGMATAAVLGVTALDILVASRLQQEGGSMPRRAARPTSRVHVERVTTINRPIEEVYAFWRRFENFPRFMRHLEKIEDLGGRRSRWTARAPAGMTVTWEAEMTEDREPELIAWRSVEGSSVDHSGSVQFGRAPGARGTEVRVRLDYRPPAGSLGRGIAWLFGEEPDQQIHEDLHRFKQLVETGEIPLSDGPSMWRAAQPAAQPETIRTHAGVER